MKNIKLAIFLILLFSQLVSASKYLEMLKELDVRIVCFLVWAAPLVTLILLGVGGIKFMISDSPMKREEARRMLYNTIVGLVLILAFILIAAHLGNLDLSRCLGEEFAKKLPKEQTPKTLECREIENCEECLKNDCAWCFFDGKCWSKEDCEEKCFPPKGFKKFGCRYLGEECEMEEGETETQTDEGDGGISITNLETETERLRP